MPSGRLAGGTPATGQVQPTSEKPQSGKRSQFVVVIIVIRRTHTQIWEEIVTVRVVAARFVAHDVHDCARVENQWRGEESGL